MGHIQYMSFRRFGRMKSNREYRISIFKQQRSHHDRGTQNITIIVCHRGRHRAPDTRRVILPARGQKTHLNITLANLAACCCYRSDHHLAVRSFIETCGEMSQSMPITAANSGHWNQYKYICAIATARTSRSLLLILWWYVHHTIRENGKEYYAVPCVVILRPTTTAVVIVINSKWMSCV